ncbi:hypothetical protein BD779DRAFT_1784782 [Infundibulicybe gibba]|nr:hypothetical protein BD779DRAFT_1784782 [Infundibulicybe gibba]
MDSIYQRFGPTIVTSDPVYATQWSGLNAKRGTPFAGLDANRENKDPQTPAEGPITTGGDVGAATRKRAGCYLFARLEAVIIYDGQRWPEWVFGELEPIANLRLMPKPGDRWFSDELVVTWNILQCKFHVNVANGWYACHISVLENKLNNNVKASSFCAFGSGAKYETNGPLEKKYKRRAARASTRLFNIPPVDFGRAATLVQVHHISPPWHFLCLRLA